MVFMATREIGLRALRRELTSVMRGVRRGEEVVVTERGKPVARIAPFEEEDVIARLRREGKVTPARVPKGSRPLPKRIPVRGSVTELLIASREALRNPSGELPEG